MFWNEKVELVKSKFSSADFKDPFRKGGGITEKIVVILFKSTWLNFVKSENRVALLKEGVLAKSCTVKQLYENELPLLNRDKNYWLLLINLPMGSSFQVYDCKYEPLRELLYLSSGQDEQEFCIVDKKYYWLLFFKIDRDKDLVKIYRKGNVDVLAP